jgi:N-acetylmuramoyl-L-alanine amidase
MKNKLARVALFMFIFIIPFTLLSLSVNINIRSFDHEGFTRIVFEGDRGFEFKIDQSRTELEIKLKGKAKLQKEITSFTRSILLDRVVHQVGKNNSVLKVHLKSRFEIKRHFVLEKPFRVVFDLVKSEKEEADAEPENVPLNTNTNEEKSQESVEPETENNTITGTDNEQDSKEEQPSSKKPEAIETICIDPGHGGSDLGAVGKSKTMEKDITLKVSKKLKQLIVSRLGLRVITTREKDTEVSLNSRVSIANNQKAQIFISIHVNSSFRKAARGSETFYVSLKATDQEALLLSQKENKSFEEIDKITEDDELKMILWDMAQNEYIKESSKLASYIQEELNILLHTTNRGVKQAPFRVLMRAAMPAVLLEIAFLSNPYEEQKLQDDAFLDQVADAIYTGISKYIYYHNTAYGFK